MEAFEVQLGNTLDRLAYLPSLHDYIADIVEQHFGEGHTQTYEKFASSGNCSKRGDAMLDTACK